jgi:hypothetical protein
MLDLNGSTGKLPEGLEVHRKELSQERKERFARLSQNSRSRGLGDTLAKIAHTAGLDKLAELYTEITGMDCGCKNRQEALNKLIPYGYTAEQ